MRPSVLLSLALGNGLLAVNAAPSVPPSTRSLAGRDKPAHPEHPDTPNKPDKPDNPNKPNKPEQPSQSNPTPFVVPALQEWNGAQGTWTLRDSSRLVVDPAFAESATNEEDSIMANPATLRDFATTFQSDIAAATGLNLEVVVSVDHGPDDIYFTLGDESNHEAYALHIGDGLTITGGSPRGAFWGTRTVLQLLILEGTTLPNGDAHDWPNYRERKFFQDIARKPIPLSDLQEYATLASFFKMNTLHHHYSDNPAVRSKALMPDWAEKYAGFRLRSDNPDFTVFTSNDTSYTRDDLRTFQDFIKARGLDLIPEIDTPAHSLFITKFRPKWSIQNDTARGDWLDLGNDEVWRFIEDLWAEFVPFFDSKSISVGADEYSQDRGELVRKYVNHLHDVFATQHNRTIRMWGSDVRLPGTTEINTDIHTDHWDWTFSNPVDLVARGHAVCNLNAPDAYLVPRTAAYWDYIPAAHIYADWEPWVFDIFDKTNTSRNLSPQEPLLTGGGFANWNDFMGESVTRVELYDRVAGAMGVFAEKLWAGTRNSDTIPYDDWAGKVAKLRAAIPGITLARRPESKGQFVLSYDFEDGSVGDASGNGNDGTPNGVEIVDAGEGHGKAAQITPGGHIATPIEGIAYPYAVGMWLKPSGEQSASAVLLEGADGRVLVSNDTNPTVTFENDNFQYTTNVILPPDVWSHLAFVADGESTYVFHNMARKASVQWYNPRWDSLRNESMVLTAPLRSIGSKDGNSFNGLVDGVFVLNRESSAGELAFLANHYANALP